MTIYLDVIWLLNLCIDYLLLLLTALSLKRTYRQSRLIVAALFASLIVFFMFTPLASLFYNAFVKLLYSACIVLIAFRFRRWSYFLKNVMMFYFITFVVGGGLFALDFFFKSEVEILSSLQPFSSSSFGSPFSWLFVIVALPLVLYFSKQQIQAITIRKFEYDKLAEVTIQFGEVTIQTTGLIDSGNQLLDPLTRAPVLIIEASLLKGKLPDTTLHALIRWEEINDAEKDEFLQKRFTVIPYKAIGKNVGLLPALRPNFIKIAHDGKHFYRKKALVALDERALSADGDFQCIVHPALFFNERDELA